MNDWVELTLEDISIINPRETIKKGTLAKKIPMDMLMPFRRKPVEFSCEKFKGGTKFQNGDTIVARITLCLENGKTAYIDILDEGEIGFGSTEYIVIREKDGISDKLFLYYFSISPDFREVAIQSMTGSSGRQRVQTDVLRKYLFLLPPLPEQKAIASVLSSLDDKIDLLHRQNKTLETMAETLFRQWFVEEAQDDWEELTLSDISTVKIGRTPPRKESEWFSTDESDVKWISIKDMGEEGVFILNTAEYLTKEAVEIHRIPIIPKETVVLSFKMTLGRVAITSSEMLSNEAIAHFILSDESRICKEYLYFYLKLFRYDSLGSTSSIVTSINSGMIKNMEILIPDKSSHDKFSKDASLIFEKIQSNQLQVQNLEQLRDTLLPKLMSGEVRVNYG